MSTTTYGRSNSGVSSTAYSRTNSGVSTAILGRSNTGLSTADFGRSHSGASIEAISVSSGSAKDPFDSGTTPVKLVVRSTFIEIDEGPSLKTHFFRRSNSDSNLLVRDSFKSIWEGEEYRCISLLLLMMKNLPNSYTRSMLIEMIDNEGFSGRYDFLYLPMDFGRWANLGYAFVNLVDASSTAAFWRTFNGFARLVGTVLTRASRHTSNDTEIAL